MWKTAALIMALATALILIMASLKPDSFRVEKKAVINAPPEAVFAAINDLQRWQSWSPWEKKDPAMKRLLSTTSAGLGASYAWEGNKEVGQGRMEITESTQPSRIRIKLDFIQPFEAHNTVLFSLTPKNGGTEVSWAMEGPTPFSAKIVHVFFNMDKMVGGDFETGLNNLKTLTEKPVTP